MRNVELNTEGKNYPKTKNYFQKFIIRKLFGRKLYKYFKYLKIILLYKFGREFEISKFLRQIIEKDFVIMDIGANLGQYSVRFTDYLKNTGLVVSVEPVKENYEYLNRLKEKYKLSNLRCINCAVSDFSGEEILSIPLVSKNIELDTRATIDKNNYYFSYDCYTEQKVTVKKLSEIVEEMGVERLDIVKSDTEGNDEKVILGSIDLIKRFFPLVLVEDSHKENWLQKLYETGYNPFYVYNDLHLIDAFQSEHYEKRKTKYDLLVLVHSNSINKFEKYIHI